MKYPLASSTWDEREIAAIESVIKSGMYTMGDRVREFESSFAAFFGSRFAVMVNSGSSANLIAVAALFFRRESALERGQEVIVPALSWSTTFAPLQQYGLHCRFVDIDPETLNYDLNKLSEAVTDKTRMVVAVNLLGNPNNFHEIKRIIDGRDIVLLEDNCESMGSRFDGKYTGTFGLMGTFSSFFSHHISTMEGGMVLTDDEELYHIMLSLRSHGWTRHLPPTNLVTGRKSENPFEESFRFVLPGYNLRPGEIHAAIGMEQLAKLPQLLETRKRNAGVFQESFADCEWVQLQKECGESSWFGFAMTLVEKAPVSRNELVAKLEEKGVACRPVISGNFLKNPIMAYFDYSVSGSISNAEYIDQNSFFVGNHHYPLNTEIEHLREIFSELESRGIQDR